QKQAPASPERRRFRRSPDQVWSGGHHASGCSSVSQTFVAGAAIVKRCSIRNVSGAANLTSARLASGQLVSKATARKPRVVTEPARPFAVPARTFPVAADEREVEALRRRPSATRAPSS